jgi:preprotein translocase subunit YajC
MNPSLMNPLILILAMVVFYFLLYRPQQQKAKEQSKFMDGLQKGDDIVTASGIIGRISRIEGNIVTLQVDQKNYIRVTKSAISKEMTDTFKSEIPKD